MPEMNEERSIGQTVELILRHWWIPALAAIVFGASAFFLTPAAQVDRQATASVGLSEAVHWPFYLQTREKYVAGARDDGLVQPIIDSTSGEVSSLEVTASTQDDTRIVITASASSVQAAQQAADALADILVGGSAQDSEAGLQVQHDRLSADIEAASQRIAELTAELEAAAITEGQFQALAEQRLDTYQDDLATLKSTQTLRSSLSTELSVLVRNKTELDFDLVELERQLAAPQAELEHVASSQVIAVDSTSPSTVAALAALVGALLATFAVTIFLGERQPISVHALAARYPDTAILSDEDDGKPLPFTTESWQRFLVVHNYPALVRTETVNSMPHWIGSDTAEAVIGTSDATQALAQTTSAVLLVSPKDRLPTIRQTQRAMQAMGVSLKAIVLTRHQ